MGEVLVIIKVFPESVEDIAKVEERLKKLSVGRVKEVKREPIAFGLELLKVGIVIPDKVEGMMEKLEASVKKISGVKEIEVEGTTLL